MKERPEGIDEARKQKHSREKKNNKNLGSTKGAEKRKLRRWHRESPAETI